MEREEKVSEGRRRSACRRTESATRNRIVGRIVSTHPGQDGMVRAVTCTVRTQYGEYKRPITKLCFLDEAET